MALRDAAASGHSVQGATAYVTLEPCAHHGRTGPCCDALIAAGVSAVVASLQDPNPKVSGQGFARLRAAGVDVTVGPSAEAARDINPGFFSRMERGTPWVRMKIAASLDGITALESGVSQWITSEAARTDGHQWRARSCAIVTGIGTVLEDNPRLDVRLIEVKRQPHVVVIDSRLEIPLDAHILIAGRARFIYAAAQNDEKKSALEALGVTVVYCPGKTPETASKVDLAAMLHDLAAREVNEVHVEAGSKLNGSLLKAGLVDEVISYIAPKLIGPGRGLASLPALSALGDAISLEFTSVEKVGPDIRIVARVVGAHP